jgi:hypothetical protein
MGIEGLCAFGLGATGATPPFPTAVLAVPALSAPAPHTRRTHQPPAACRGRPSPVRSVSDLRTLAPSHQSIASMQASGCQAMQRRRSGLAAGSSACRRSAPSAGPPRVLTTSPAPVASPSAISPAQPWHMVSSGYTAAHMPLRHANVELTWHGCSRRSDGEASRARGRARGRMMRCTSGCSARRCSAATWSCRSSAGAHAAGGAAWLRRRSGALLLSARSGLGRPTSCLCQVVRCLLAHQPDQDGQ